MNRLNLVCEFCSSVNSEEQTVCFVCGTLREAPLKREERSDETEIISPPEPPKPKCVIVVPDKKDSFPTEDLLKIVVRFGWSCLGVGLLFLAIGLFLAWNLAGESDQIANLWDTVKNMFSMLTVRAQQRLQENAVGVFDNLQCNFQTSAAYVGSLLHNGELVSDGWFLSFWDRCGALFATVGS